MVVGDRFSGYEWRLVLESDRRVQLVAFVIPPDPDQLTIARYPTDEDAVRAGGSRVRWCEPDLVTIRCGRPARGVVRLAGDRLEVVVSEPRWLQAVLAAQQSTLHLAVRRGGVELWSTSLPLLPEPE